MISLILEPLAEKGHLKPSHVTASQHVAGCFGGFACHSTATCHLAELNRRLTCPVQQDRLGTLVVNSHSGN